MKFKGGDIPDIGFGTWQLNDGQETIESVLTALEAGYRLIDTAKIYGNESGVGQALKQSGLAREELFITTKLWPADFSSAGKALQESLKRLKLAYIDLYLIHWPGHDRQLRLLAWQTMEKARSESLIKHIGVSNYMPQHLAEMADYAKVMPAINQIEFHPFIYEQQRPALEASHKLGVAVEAYSPLARAHNLKNKLLTEIAARYSKTPAQIMLRWAIQHKTVPIPKSGNRERIIQNFDVFDFKLAAEDMKTIDGLSGRGAFG
jgi:diketogulonate reductase-like aldo/keto reductase